MKKEGMKTKDVIELVVALIVFLVAAFLIYGLLNPNKGGQKASQGATVTIVTPLQTDFDQGSLRTMSDNNQTVDFYQAPDLHSGLGNTHPFTQQ